jgi:ATP-dependent DNA ligase
VTLPLTPPVLPQLARSAPDLPTGDGWAYEPKWDGFRAIAFVEDGELTSLQSRNGRPLLRYFPELTFPAGSYVLDGEIVIDDPAGGQDFEALGQRIHPAKSRIDRLAGETPARFVAFDLLAEGEATLLERSYGDRRDALERLLDTADAGSVALTPCVRKAADAERWLHDAEGVIAKQLAAPYRPGERVGMVKIKRVRTIDCVAVGWRPGKHEGTIGALILGLYDGDDLHVVGHTSGFSAREKKELPAFLAPYESGERGSGEASRWTQGRELEWVGLRPELVCEVTFDHVSGRRIRHGANFMRWREDKAPGECGVDQLRQ